MATSSKTSSIVKLLQNYAKAHVRANLGVCSTNEKKALSKLVKASKLIDEIFMEQMWEGNNAYRSNLEEKSPESDELRYYMINRGPWDRLDEDKPFLPEIGGKPLQANFYPADLTKEEWHQWVKSLPEKEAEEAKSAYTTIRRDEEKNLKAVKYCDEYAKWLNPASKLVHEAADLVSNDSLKKFLHERADAFLSNEYRESEISWLKIDEASILDITIGPYEVYEDNFLNLKAAFETFITIRDPEATSQLKMFGDLMQELEDHLPVEDKHKNPAICSQTPIVVVDQVFSGGDVGGPMTSAFNLPNDIHVSKKHGNKLVILRNVQQIKFEKVLTPISKIAIREDQREYIDFGSFFTHILCHEMSHSLGPHFRSDDKSKGVRSIFEELHSALEEAKADIVGLWALQYLISNHADKMKNTAKSIYVTFLASAFRSVRFGLEEAHGKGQALQLNFLIDEGGFQYDEQTKSFYVDFEKIPSAVEKLTGVILRTQGSGSKDDAKSLMDKYAINRQYSTDLLERLKTSAIPVDIAPMYDEFEE